MRVEESAPSPPSVRAAGEVFTAFLRLGLTAFGGPVAHIAYFRDEFVSRRAWLDDARYAQLVALCQFLPGPTSSQVGFSLGLLRAGWAGAAAAFAGFTLPSVLLLLGFAAVAHQVHGDWFDAVVRGLKLVALVVVAHAVLGMARQLCPDRVRASIAVAAAVVVLLAANTAAQIAAILVGALAGWAFCRDAAPAGGASRLVQGGRGLGIGLLLAFFALMLVLPWLAATTGGPVAVVDAFYRAGGLVFGGGHVVLPLLEQALVDPGWLSAEDFLAGYGAAQAVPGPMFSVAAFYGYLLEAGAGGLPGAATALIALFLPGFLLVAAVLPLWSAWSAHAGAAGALAGVNAAVVGLLGSALYDPVWLGAVRGADDLAIGLVGFLLLATWRLSPLWVVAWGLGASLLAGMPIQ
jgi:chromate transporter